MSATYTEWAFQLYNRRTGRPISDSTGLYRVLTAAAPTNQTVYSDRQGTSLTMPGTLASGSARFFTVSTVTTVDVTILTAAGQSFFVEALTPSQHRVDVDPEVLEYTFITNFNMNTASAVAIASGFSILAGMKVNDVFAQVITTSTGTAAFFGVSGTPLGFGNLIPTTVTGWKNLDVVIAEDTEGSSLVASTQNRGTLLVDFRAGLSGITWSVGSPGNFNKLPYICTAATALVYGPKITNTAGLGTGYLYIRYELVPTQGN